MTAEHRLAHDFIDAHPARAALRLEQMPTEQVAAVLRAVPARSAAGAFRDMTSSHAAGCLEALGPEDAAAIVALMTVDDAARIVRALDAARREALLAALPEETREPLGRILAYPEGTAGAVMDPAIFQLPDDGLVADARERLRHAAHDLLYYLYVVDRGHRLVGVLDIPELMLARPRDPVNTAMNRDVERLSAWMPVALVRTHAGWHRYHALPVVDEQGRLLGAVRYQTLRRLEREATDRGPDPAQLTARALGELFQLGTSGLLTGVAVASAAIPSRAADADEGTGPPERSDA